MNETPNTQSNEQADNGCADAVAAIVLMSVTLLGVINFVYTGGLVAFFGL